MVSLKEKKNDLKQNKIVFSLFINIIVLLLTLLFFEVTTKVDDYDMCTIFYGGVTGEYSEFFLYGNVLIGYLIKALLTFFPDISWYYVILFTGTFVSLNLLTYVLLKKATSGWFSGIWLCILVFFAYELYIRLTFTKVTGVIIASGLLYIFYCIEKEEKRILQYILGISWVVFGTLFRDACYKLVVFSFFSLFFYYILKEQRTKKWLIKNICKFILILAVITGVEYGFSMISAYHFQNDEGWSAYSNYNSARANLYDYGIPEFSENIEEYKELGISQNDYVLWFSLACISDGDRLTTELMEEIRNIEPLRAKSLFESMYEACHMFLNYFYYNTLGYAIIILYVIIFLCSPKYEKIFSVIIFLNGWAGYIYMYYCGRIQYHTNVVLFASVAMTLAYIATGNLNTYNKKVVCLTIPMIMIFWLTQFHYKYSSSSYYERPTAKLQSEAYNSYRKTMDVLSEDKSHLYILSAYENEIYYCFTPFEVIPKGYYSNIYRLNHYSSPVLKAQLKIYNVDNIFKDIVNSDMIYYAATKARQKDLDIVCSYIEDHYYDNVSYELVETVGTMNIYRFISE